MERSGKSFLSTTVYDSNRMPWGDGGLFVPILRRGRQGLISAGAFSCFLSLLCDIMAPSRFKNMFLKAFGTEMKGNTCN